MGVVTLTALLALGCKPEPRPRGFEEPPPDDDKRAGLPPLSPLGLDAATPAGPTALGKSASAGAFQLTALSTKSCVPTRWVTPRKGRRWLGVEIELKSLGESAVPANPHYASLKYRGSKAAASSRAGGCEPELRHKPLTKGSSARGWVSFEIPEGAQDLVFVYEPALVGGVAGRTEHSLALAPRPTP